MSHKCISRALYGDPRGGSTITYSMTELSKIEEAEEQAFLEDVDVLQTPEEHAKNLAILKDQKGQRIK